MTTKIKPYCDKVTDFSDKKIPKVDSNHVWLAVISLNSDQYYYPQGWQPSAVIISLFRQTNLRLFITFGCSSKKVEKFPNAKIFKNRILSTQSVRFYPKTLLKNWFTKVTEKVIHKLYSKIDPQPSLKNCPTTVTQKVIHKR